MIRTVKIISGGQTGVDRAALDAARELGLECGGWCPRGRKCEFGTIPAEYPLKETPLPSYEQRTEWNVRDSDGTLVVVAGRPRPGSGTDYTLRLAEELGRPTLVVDPGDGRAGEAVRSWIADHAIRVLNVAGPRESQSPGIQNRALAFLRQALAGIWESRPEAGGAMETFAPITCPANELMRPINDLACYILTLFTVLLII